MPGQSPRTPSMPDTKARQAGVGNASTGPRRSLLSRTATELSNVDTSTQLPLPTLRLLVRHSVRSSAVITYPSSVPACRVSVTQSYEKLP